MRTTTRVANVSVWDSKKFTTCKLWPKTVLTYRLKHVVIVSIIRVLIHSIRFVSSETFLQRIYHTSQIALQQDYRHKNYYIGFCFDNQCFISHYNFHTKDATFRITLNLIYKGVNNIKL